MKMLASTTSDLNHYFLIILLISILYRLLISLYPYSGQNKSPMFGDYEAQRHWMEVTYNLNVNDWYKNTTDNDLLYWGLDYPPLTAYHSQLMGYFANKINPKFVELHESRGYESDEHKLFMRITVLIADLLLYYPAVYLLNKKFNKNHHLLETLFVYLINPAILLIDYGHFQYNCVSLGLMLFTIYYIFTDKIYYAAVFYCLSLNYKQMQLYYSFPIFFYLLSKCLFSSSFKEGVSKLINLGLCVVFTFALCWLPYLTSLEQILHVLNRLFPFSRGLFEDKVANFWCSISIVVKLKDLYSISTLKSLCFLATFLSLLPSSVNLLFNSTKQKFLLALINSSLIFYLFSFQVHEKSILLATIPACLLISHYPLLITWFLIISTFSMFPLLYKDGLQTAYYCTILVFYTSVYVFMKPFSSLSKKLSFLKYMFFLSMLGTVILTTCHSLDLKLKFLFKNKTYPDIWPVLICLYSFAHFSVFLVAFHFIQFKLTKTNDDGLDFKTRLLNSHNKKAN